MAAKTVKSLTSIIEETAALARGNSGYKTAAASTVERPYSKEVPVNSFQSAQAKAIHKAAAYLRSAKIAKDIRLEALSRVLSDDYPSRDDLSVASHIKTAAASFSEGATDSETLRNTAKFLVDYAESVEKTAHVKAYNAVLGLVAAEKLTNFLA